MGKKWCNTCEGTRCFCRKPLRIKAGWTWKTNDGRKLKLDEITDIHLGNILRYLKENNRGHPNYNMLHEEAHRRQILWRPNKLTYCSFPVDDGTVGQCSMPAVMYTAADKVNATKISEQQPRCEKHRPDRHAYKEDTCAGCMKVALLVIEVNKEMYCQECITDHTSPFWDTINRLIAIVVMVTTLGIKRY